MRYVSDHFTEMLAHSISSRSHLLIIYIIIPMHTHISTVLMIRPSQEILPDVRVDLDVCYNVRYYTHFVGEINCSSDCIVYNSQDHGLIRYSPEQGWQFQDKPFICMCSCNFNTKELRNGYVVGNSVVSHESYLNYTCNPGFTKTTSNRIMCLDGIFVSVESDGNVELPESIKETSTIFREYPLSKKDFSKLSNSVHKFVIDSDSWTCNGYPAQKGFVHNGCSNKVPYKLLSSQEEKCYKDGHIDISRLSEIGCIKEITYPLTPVDSVHQNIKHILSASIVGFVVVFITVGIMMFYLARRKVSKAMQMRSFRECDPQFSSGKQESAPTSSGEFCVVVFNNYSTYLTGSGVLYPTENKHLFYSKSGKCRIACVLTPKSLRKNFSSDDFSWTIDSKYLEDDSDGVEYLPEDSERPQCSNMTENINSWPRHISERSKSDSDISEKDLQSRNLYTRSHSDSFKPAAACTVMEENNASVVNEDRKEESSSQLARIDESVKECTVMEENNASVVNEDRKEESSSQLERNNESVTVCTVTEENNASVVNEDRKEESSLQLERNNESVTVCTVMEENNASVVIEDWKEESSSQLERNDESVTVCTVMEENNASVVNEDRKEESSLQLERNNESVTVCTVMEENNAGVVNEDRKEQSSLQLKRNNESVTVCTVMEENNASVVNEDRKEESSSQLERIDESVKECTVMEENNASVVNKDWKEESSSQLERINESVKVYKDVMHKRLNDDSQICKENATLHQEDNDERETTPLMTDTNNMKHDGSSVSMLDTSLTEEGSMLNANNSKSDMNLCHLSSRGMDPDSSRWKSDPYIFAPSLLEKAWRAIKKKIFRRKDSHFQSFLTCIETDCI